MRKIYNKKEAYLKEKNSNSKHTAQYISDKNIKLNKKNNKVNISKLNKSFPNKNNDSAYYDNTIEKTLLKLNHELICYDNTKENTLTKLEAIPENNINNNNIKNSNREEKNNSIKVNKNFINNKEEIKIIVPNKILENKKMDMITTTNSSFNTRKDDISINIPKNFVEKRVNKKRINFDCCYCYGPNDNNRFKDCICCNPYKKYCCFIVFLAYLWFGIIYFFVFY